MSTHNQRQAEKARIRRDGLAELVSEGAPIAEAAQAMGMSYATARKLWSRIRSDLGWQAQ